jgi:GT2 family glycosyltransferase
MISIIICSRKSYIPLELKENICKTIGLEYEILNIDNSNNKYSIFSAYNEGVRRARFQFLCFMHDDVLFHTNGWGEKVISHFQDEKVGIIGTFGSHFMPKTPIGWYQSKLVSGGGIQRFIENGKHRTERQMYLSYLKEDLSIEAVVVDGLWFCIPKSVFNLLSFDEHTFSGFHCYDLDICMQIRKEGFHVRIISDILIEHFSLGGFNQDWVKNTLLFFEKWKEQLPQLAGIRLSKQEMKIREEIVSETFIWMSAYAQCNQELKNIRQSKAYKLGKLILKPFSKLRTTHKKIINRYSKLKESND